MLKASVRELRNATKTIVNAVSHGSTVTLTYHGRDCAKIIPVKTAVLKEREEDIFGMWKDNPQVKSVNKFINNLRGGRALFL